jgi:hypothetical protein
MITTQWLGRFISRSVLTLLAAGLIAVSGAQAQATKIFVASFGNDGNDGSRGSPKRNFQSAHDAVAAGGQIVVLDTAGYGQLTITKSLAVTVPPGVNGFVSVTGNSNAITVNAGPVSRVSLRGLIIEGGGSRQSIGTDSPFGIYVTSVGSLTVEECTIRNFLDGLVFSPSNNDARLAVYNSRVRNCRYGIDVQASVSNPNPSQAFIADCRLEDTGDAIYSTNAYVAVDDSIVANSTIGLHCAGESHAFIAANNCRFNYVNNVCAGNNAASGDHGTIESYGNNTAYLSSAAFNKIRSFY